MKIKFINLNESRLSQAIQQNPRFRTALMFYFVDSVDKLSHKFIPLITHLLKINYPDIIQIATILKKFEQYPHFFKSNGFFSDQDILSNLEKFKSISYDLDKLILQKLENKKLLDFGTSKLFEDSEFLLLKINNYIAAFKYSRQTTWCLNSTDAKKWFDFYTKNPPRPLYILINKSLNKKYAFIINSSNEYIILNDENQRIYDVPNFILKGQSVLLMPWFNED